MATSLNVSIKFKRDRRAIGIDDGTSAIAAVQHLLREQLQ